MATGTDRSITVNVNAKDHTKAALSGVKRNLNSTSKEATTLSRRFRELSRATLVMEGPLGGTAGRLSAMGTLFNSVSLGMVAFGASMAAMTAVAFKSIQAFAEMEQQTYKIDTLLKQTGYSAGVTGQQIEEMAQSIGEGTLESTAGVREAAATLLTFKSVAGDAFGRTLEVAADLAAVSNVDLKGAIIQLGKALEDPAQGLSALRRSGVTLSEQQKKMIVDMKNAGDEAGAQAATLKILEDQLGGAARGAGKGLSGAIDLVNEKWGRLLENLSKGGAGKALTETANSLANVLDKLAKWADPDLDQRRYELGVQIVEQQEKIARLKEEASKATHGDAKYETMSVLVAIDKLKVLQDQADELDRMALNERRAPIEAELGAMFEKEKRDALAEQNKLIEEQNKKKEQAKKDYERENKAASTYALRLVDEERKFQDSLLAKSQAEDLYLEDRLAKLDEYLQNKMLTEQEYNDATAAAYAMHNAKVTQYQIAEDEKAQEAKDRLRQREWDATQSAFGDISSLMSSENSKLFKVGQAAAIANAVMNTHEAITKTMASVPYPFNIPLAVAQGVAGMAQVNQIRSQKFQAAKEFGGTVIGGRTYLVGERGPELFTPPSTGSIVTNNETFNNGATNNISVTVMNDVGDEFIERNANRIWNSILDRMNEDGLRFA